MDRFTTCFQLGHINHVLEELQQASIVLENQFRQLSTLFLRGRIRQHFTKANNSIKWCTYLVTNISKESCFQSVTLLSLITGFDECHFYLFLLINTHGGANNSQRMAIGITLVHNSIGFTPIYGITQRRT